MSFYWTQCSKKVLNTFLSNAAIDSSRVFAKLRIISWIVVQPETIIDTTRKIYEGNKLMVLFFCKRCGVCQCNSLFYDLLFEMGTFGTINISVYKCTEVFFSTKLKES